MTTRKPNWPHNPKSFKGICKALAEDNRHNLFCELDELKGSAAVLYFIHAMLDNPEHKHNLQSVLNLLSQRKGDFCGSCGGSGVMFDTQDDGHMVIERCDTCKKYESDEAAMTDVRKVFEVECNK